MYSPEIAKDLIPILYKLGKEKKKPMTRIVDDILRSALKSEKASEDKERREVGPS